MGQQDFIMTRLIAIDFDQNGNPQSMKEVGDGQAISLDLPQYQDEASAKNDGLVAEGKD